MTLDNIGELLYGRFLSSVSWNVFDHVVVLVFDDGKSDLQITLTGVCAVVSRQQVDSSEYSDFGPECEVQYAAITNHNEFLDRLLTNRLGLETGTGFYDANRRSSEDPDFTRPNHLSLSCDAGNLDIVFRECKVIHRV